MREITQKLLKECLSYNKSTGIFRWIERPLSHFKTANRWKGFNTVNKGRVAGCISAKGYRWVSLFNKTYREHRLVWLYVYGEWPVNTIDHIDGIHANNKIENLRDVTQQENSKNLPISKLNKSGVSGVQWDKVESKWSVRINVKEKSKRFGSFSDLELAELVVSEVRVIYGYHKNHGRSRT